MQAKDTKGTEICAAASLKSELKKGDHFKDPAGKWQAHRGEGILIYAYRRGLERLTEGAVLGGRPAIVPCIVSSFLRNLKSPRLLNSKWFLKRDLGTLKG